jgi:hypothetical protein
VRELGRRAQAAAAEAAAALVAALGPVAERVFGPCLNCAPSARSRLPYARVLAS